MSISTWFSNWLASRKAEQRAAAPDHSARLFVRRLEDRQVLSVSSILVGTDVTFTGDDGGVSADSIIFSVDIDGNLEHNLGGTNGFHSNIDLDNSVAGDQILAVDDITQLSIDLGADSDSVDFADHFDFALASLSVTAESISATLGSLSVSGLAQFDAGSANSISLLGSNDFHQVQIVSADNVFLNDINELEFAGASAVTGDLEVTFGSLVTDQLTNAAGASLWVGDLASFSGGSISLGEAVGDTLHFGRLHLDAVGAVVVEEDSATELTGDVFASELRLVSAGDITDTTGAIQITGLASFSGSSISLGGALANTNFGSLNFSSTGAVAVQEDSATELAGANSALSLQIVSAGDLTDTSASLMVSDLAQFEGTSITLGGATRSTELGMLTFSSLGDVSIQVDAATQLAGDNAALSLVLDSTGAISDSSSSLSVTNHAELSGSSIAIGGAGISTNFGSLSFHSLGAVTVQEDSSTQVSAASTAGSLDLQSVGQVQLDATVNVTNGASITADGAISVSDAMSSGGTASLTSQNGVTVDAVIEGATVSIEAADGIVVNARIEAVDAIELTAGTDGSGSVQTALAGDLFASNAGGTATIQIASGVISGGVLLARATTADSLVRITSASEINGLALITASEIELFAATGIGTLATLQLSGATITAQSSHGNIDLNNAVAATYAQVSTGTGTIAVFNTGAAVFTDVTTTDGAIHLVAVDGDLTVGTNVSAGGADADDNVTLLNANGNIVLTGTTTAIGNQVLAITDGSIGGAGQVSTADVDLQAGTGINANLAAENIRVTTTSGGVQLSNTAISPQTTLDLTTGGDAEVHNTGALSIVGTVDGDLTVTVTAGDLTDSGPLSVSGTSSLLAAGDVILDHTSNDFGGAVAVSGQAVELIDANSLTLGQIDAVTVQVTASGSITLGTGAGEDLEATDCVQLHADSGGVVQQAGSTILTDRLALTGTGPFTLEQANDVNVLAVNIDGSIHFADSNALIVGTACGVSGLATSGQDARLSTGGNLTIGEAGDLGVNDVSLGTGDLTLDVTGAITQLSGNTISATGLQLLGGGGSVQLSESNTVATLAADRDGTIEFTNSDALTVGTVTDTAGTLAVSTSGVTTSGDDVRLIVLGDLLIDEAISLGAGALSLNVTGTISQNAGDTITAAGLSLSGNGAGAELGGANDIDTFASDYQGTVLLSDNDDLTVGSVTAVGATTTGISNTLDTKLTTGGDLHLAEAVDLGPGTLLLDVDGAVTQSATGTIQAAGLALLVTGTTSLDQSNDVDILAADTEGSVLLSDIDDLTVGSVTCGPTTVAGIATTFDVKLVTGGDLQLAEAVDLGLGNLLLEVDGAITQSASGSITAASLALMVDGTTALDQANDVDTLAANSDDTVLFRDLDDLAIGSVTVAGLTISGISTASDTRLVTGGDLTLTEAVNVGPGHLLLDVDGAITQSDRGTIQATGLALLVTGTTTLDQNNDVDLLAADTQGSVEFNDIDALTVSSVTAIGMTVRGVTSTSDVKLVIGNELQFDEAVDLGSGNLSLDVDGAVSQSATGVIQAAGLALSVMGTTTLDQANDVDTLAAQTQGSVRVSDVDDLTVGSVTSLGMSITGLSTTFDAHLVTGGNLHLAEAVNLGSGNLLLDVDGAVTQSATGTITAAGLALMVIGTTTLDQANVVDTFAADTQGSVLFNDVDDLTVGSVTSFGMTVVGISTTFDTKLVTGGNLTLTEAVNVGPGNVLLDVDGAITQTAGGTIQAAGLVLIVTGNTTLDQANDVDRVAADAQGSFVLKDVDDLTVGSVTCGSTNVVGISTTLDTKLITGSDLHVAERIDLGPGNLLLDVDGAVTQSATGTITATGLALRVTGSTTLHQANDVDTLAADTQGSIQLRDVDDLIVGSVTCGSVTITGISTNFDTKLITGGNLHLAEAIDLGPGSLFLDVDGSVTQSATGTITAEGLALMVTGSTALDQANDVDTLAAESHGTLLFNDVDDLTVGSVTSLGMTVSGLATTFDTKLVAGSNLQLDADIDLGPGNLFLDVDGALTQSASGTINAAGLALQVTGSTTLDQANDVDTLAAETQGAVIFRDIDDLTVGSVTTLAMTVSGLTTTFDTKLITGGNLHLAEAVDLGPNNLLLNVDGTVTQSTGGTIQAAGLALLVTGSTTLDQANHVDTLAAETQRTVLFHDIDDLTVGSVTCGSTTITGILSTFDTRLVTGGDLHLAEAVDLGLGNLSFDVHGTITQSAAGAITAAGLALRATGSTTLDQANDVDTLAADAQGSVQYSDVDDLAVGLVTSLGMTITGLSTTLDAKLITGGNLHLAEAVDLGAGNLLLSVDGDVTQSAGGTIIAAGLALMVTGSTTLNQANDVDTFAADTQDSVFLNDIDNLTVGSATSLGMTVTGIRSAFDARLVNGGDLHFDQAVDLGPGNLLLDVDGAVTQSATGTITAAGLALMVTGRTKLDQANDVDALAADTEGTLLFNDVNDLTVGSVTSLGMTVTGIRSTFDAKLTTGRDLQLAEAVDLRAGNLFLDVDGDVTQSATGTITAAGLALMVSGGTTLDQANDVETLAAQTQGSVEFHDVDDLQIGIVSENASPANMSITGATVDDADFTVSVGAGNLTLEQAIDTGAGDIRLEATTGSILDGQDGLTQITAHNLSLTAQTQIGDIVDFADGTGDAIDVSLTGQLIQASVTDAGGEIFLSFQGDLSAASGAVNVGGSNAASAILRATGGDIDVGTAIGVFSLSSGDNLALEAIEIAGAGGTLVLPDAGLDVGVGDLRLRGDVDVRDAADRNLGPLVADDLHFTSGAGSGDTTLTTRINTLTAQITGSGAGLTVLEADGLVLTDIDLVDGDLAVHASQSTAGDIEVIDVAVGDARITLDTTAHGGGQIVDADTLDDPNRADLTATEIDLRAGSGIAHGAKLEIAAERLAAMTVSGQINIRDVAGDLTIAALARGTAGVSVTAGVAGDDICISTVGAMTVNADVSSSGIGDREILLAADGDTAAHDLTVNADLSTTRGNSSITLLAGDSILFAGTTITSAAGTGAVQARAGRVFQNGGVESAGSASGDILMSDGSIIQSDNGTITLSAPNDIQLSVVNANAAGVDGDIVLTADADGSGTGQIREVLSGESSNLIADHVTFTAAGGIGTADDIDTTVISIEAANTTSGSIIIHEIDALAITGTGVQTQAGNGNVQVTVDAGTLTVDSAVSAHGSGDVTLTATAGAAELNAEISSTSGDIQIAGDSVTQSSDITTGGTGTIQVVADTGSMTMADGTQTSTELGSIDYSAAGDIVISLIRSDSGPLSITADSDNSLDGAIIDNTAGETANLATGGTLTLLAATGIGSGDDLNTDVGLLTATNTTSGDISIREADGLIVTGSGVQTQGGDGDISLVVDDGTLVVNSLIAAHGSGNVTLEATQGPAELNATVSSTSGNLTIMADAVNQNIGGDLETGSSGTIEVTADAGSITMADGTASTTTAGNILYSATADVLLSHLSSRSGDLTVRAGAGPSAVGAIIDNTVDELPNLQTTGSATLIAETGIGASDDIDTAVSRLDLTNSTRGAIQITEVDAVQIAQLSQSGGGHVFVQTTNGSITVDNSNVTPQAIRVSGGGSLVLDANGAGANVIVNDAIQSIGGDITLLADRNIETHSAAVATTGGDGDLTLVAGRDIRILDPGNLNPIDLQATGSGTVSLRATNELVLGSQNPRDPNAVQHTTLNDVVVASQTGQITNTLPILFDVRSPQVTAEGEAVLSVTIGRPGETNLAVRVYWGDGTVETFTGLVAGTYTYRHFYTANPNPLDPAAPILVNVQVAHDPKILLVAPNVNSSVLSVLNGAIAIPPQVPTPNINADLAKAIYNPGDPLFPTLQGQIVSSPGSEAAPGTVVFQDTTFLATTIPVPGEGLATFVFDTTPPVKLLDFPEGIKIVDTLPPSTVQVSEGTAAQLVAEGADDAASGERQVILEVISPTGEVIQQAVLPESTLDDLQTIIGRLPDGQYRFQLKEAGEDRLRLLLEFEVRQGKIADETDATDRPPSNKKPAATEPMEPDAEEEAPDQNEARLLLPELPDDDDSVHSPVTPKPPRAVSMAARRAWKHAAEITSPDHTLDETDPADATASDDSDTRAAALGVMVAVVGAGLAVPERSRSQRVPGPQLGRVSRLLRRVRSTASGLLTENRQLNANEMAAPMVLPLGEWTSC